MTDDVEKIELKQHSVESAVSGRDISTEMFVRSERLEHGLSDLYYQAAYLQRIGNIDEARVIYEEIQKQLGTEQGAGKGPNDARERVAEAAKWAKKKVLIKRISLSPGSIKKRNALHEKATSIFQAGRFEESIPLYEAELNLDSRYIPALIDLGTSCYKTKRYDDALKYLQCALLMNPRELSALNSLGLVFSSLGLYKEAADYFDQAIRIQPDFIPAYLNKGNVFHKLNLLDAALESYSRAIDLDSSYAKAYAARARIFMQMRRYEEAFSDFQCIDPCDPEYSYLEVGVALDELGRLEESVEQYDLQIAFGKKTFYAYSNKGRALQKLGHYVEAFAAYEQAINVNPDYPLVYWNMSLLLLLMGKYELGWELYEWRWKREDFEKQERILGRPLWLGKEDLTGKALLITTEQGIGDMLQFCRYALLARERGAVVYLEVIKPLAALIKTIDPLINIIEKGQALPAYDYYCPLMSLPHAFATRVETIPAYERYLTVDKVRQSVWRDRLGKTDKLRVGVVWSGRAAHVNDADRSIKLDEFSRLFSIDADFHCLQKDFREGDLEKLHAFSQVKAWNTYLVDFMDTAALASEMDVIVSVDTSVAHLAGAIGKPVWILVAFSPDFRWLLDRDDSPWYPSVRIFRQPRLKDWSSVLNKVRNTLITAAGLTNHEPEINGSLPLASPEVRRDSVEKIPSINAAFLGQKFAVTDVIYIHSPITYSMARRLEAEEIMHDPVVFCGRKMTWPGNYIEVLDDGIWNIERVCEFLRKLVRVADDRKASKLNVYIPHTGLLLGTILKHATLINKIFYIEEGDAAYDVRLWNAAVQAPRIDVPELISTLNVEDTAVRLGLDTVILERIGDLPIIWFDDRQARYGGSYAVGCGAFKGLNRVKRISMPAMDILCTEVKPWICLLPCLSNTLATLQGAAQEGLLHRLVTMLSTQKALIENLGAKLIIKLHPVDKLNFHDALKTEIYRHGMSYEDFCFQNQLDGNWEVSVFNFEKFIVINESSAKRYIRLFREKSQLVELILS